MPPTVELFEPADYSMQELRFLVEHLTETPNVALFGKLPYGVSPDAIRNALGRFSELDELHRVKNAPWVGYEPIKDSIERFIAFQEKCLEGQANGEPRHPSQQTWDSTGAISRGGIGADSQEKVRNELLPDGTRKPFAVPLTTATRKRTSMWSKASASSVPDELKVGDNGVITCTICDKVVVSFDVDKGPRAKNKARRDARTHCMKASREIARHRAIANVPIA